MRKSFTLPAAQVSVFILFTVAAGGVGQLLKLLLSSTFMGSGPFWCCCAPLSLPFEVVPFWRVNVHVLLSFPLHGAPSVLLVIDPFCTQLLIHWWAADPEFGTDCSRVTHSPPFLAGAAPAQPGCKRQLLCCPPAKASLSRSPIHALPACEMEGEKQGRGAVLLLASGLLQGSSSIPGHQGQRANGTAGLWLSGQDAVTGGAELASTISRLPPLLPQAPKLGLASSK